LLSAIGGLDYEDNINYLYERKPEQVQILSRLDTCCKHTDEFIYRKVVSAHMLRETSRYLIDLKMLIAE